MIKLILCIFLIITSFLVGNSFSVKLIARRKTLTELLESMSRIKTQICFGNMDVYTVVSQTYGLIGGFEGFKIISDEDLDFICWYSKCLRSVSSATGLTQEDIDILQRFSLALGVTDIVGQISNCELYTALINEQLSKAKEEEITKCRLYRVLGFSLGTITALMFM